MNWVHAYVFVSLLAAGLITLPWGLLILAFLAWLVWISRV